MGLSDTKFKVEFRQVDDSTGQGQKQTVAFITPSGGGSGVKINNNKDVNPDQQTLAGVKPEADTSPRLQPPPLPPQPVFDPKLVEDFLAGEYCLNGVTM